MLCAIGPDKKLKADPSLLPENSVISPLRESLGSLKAGVLSNFFPCSIVLDVYGSSPALSAGLWSAQRCSSAWISLGLPLKIFNHLVFGLNGVNRITSDGVLVESSTAEIGEVTGTAAVFFSSTRFRYLMISRYIVARSATHLNLGGFGGFCTTCNPCVPFCA